MKQLFQKISVSILSLIVLFSTMSFTIDKHFCGETLVDVAYFGEADGCGMEGMRMNSDAAKMKKKNCCKNETELIESATFDKEKITTIDSKVIEFVIFYAYSYIDLYQSPALEKKCYKDFFPPDIEQNFHVLFQTFLI